MKNLHVAFLTFFTILLYSCSSDDTTKDVEKPSIDLSIAGAFPTSCSIVSKGETISFKALFKDNEELGSYSINIHENFDHHAHDTEVEECNHDEEKTPVNPWEKSLTFDIPDNLKEVVAEQEIAIPSDIDTGNYHFTIQLTDKQGWSTIKGISIKIID